MTHDLAVFGIVQRPKCGAVDADIDRGVPLEWWTAFIATVFRLPQCVCEAFRGP
ncbi:MAG: hypothetical protein GKR94_26265 [Gammaproteobacteria bacterium]|nr:hypothetical protein [Gammaproteobacteria bacterium]